MTLGITESMLPSTESLVSAETWQRNGASYNASSHRKKMKAKRAQTQFVPFQEIIESIGQSNNDKKEVILDLRGPSAKLLQGSGNGGDDSSSMNTSADGYAPIPSL
jgi:hypothetical protein